jgi:hypothetical protein
MVAGREAREMSPSSAGGGGKRGVRTSTLIDRQIDVLHNTLARKSGLLCLGPEAQRLCTQLADLTGEGQRGGRESMN